MEFFHEPKIDWMGIKWYFIALSLALAAAGLISMVVKKGLAYGIDFRGGTVVNVKFAKAPNLDAIRSELDRQNLRGATIQRIRRTQRPRSHYWAGSEDHDLKRSPGSREAGHCDRLVRLVRAGAGG